MRAHVLAQAVLDGPQLLRLVARDGLVPRLEVIEVHVALATVGPEHHDPGSRSGTVREAYHLDLGAGPVAG